MSDQVTSLQTQIEDLKKQLSAARRAVKPEPIRDYTLRTADDQPITLSALFASKPDLIVIHNMGRKCPYCTLWADGFNGLSAHLASRAAFVLSSPDEPKALREFAASRGWKFATVSTYGTTFTADLGYEPEPGRYWPGVSAFRKLPSGAMERTGKATFGPGDDFCSAWPLFDLLGGGAKNWEPRYVY